MASGITNDQLTTKSKSIITWLKQHHLKCLEQKPRGLQVKVKLKCLKHGTIFKASIFALQHTKTLPKNFCPKCLEECTRDAIYNHKKLVIYEILRSNIELMNEIIQAIGKYKHHIIISYNQQTRQFKFLCKKTNEYFYTKNIHSEIGFSKTSCSYCAELTKKIKQQKVNKINQDRANKQIEKSKTYNYHWENGNRVCNTCGSILEKNERICRVCHPKKHHCVYKGYSQKQISTITGIKRKIKAIKNNTIILKKKIAFFTYFIQNECYNVRILDILPRKKYLIKYCIGNNTPYFFNTKTNRTFSKKQNKSSSKNKHKNTHSTIITNILNHTPTKYLQKIYYTMPAKLSRVEVIQKAKEKVANYPNIVLIGVNKSGSKIKYKCTKHNEVYIKQRKNFFWAKYLCDSCRHENLGINISTGLTGKISIPKDSNLEIVQSHVKLTREQIHTLNTGKYGILVKCKRCGQQYLTTARLLKKHNYKCKICELAVSGAKSIICNNWLAEMKELFHLKDIIGHNSREKTFRINGRLYKVDGYDPVTNTVFEFFGDYWHQYESENKSFKKTFIRLGILSKRFTIVYVWEHDYKDGKPFSGVMGSITPLLDQSGH